MRAANNLERVKNRDFGNLCGYISDVAHGGCLLATRRRPVYQSPYCIMVRCSAVLMCPERVKGQWR